jgi:CheY-like chemotaxis protein
MEKMDSILLIDDDNISNFINTRLIKRLNIAHQVQVRLNGQEALSYINEDEKKCPDLIFLDINMPVMNGFEFLQSFTQGKYCNRKPIIIILTTSSDGNDMDQLQKYPEVSGFLNKPLTEDKIASVLKTHFVR